MSNEAGQSMAQYMLKLMLSQGNEAARNAVVKSALDGDADARAALKDILAESDSRSLSVPTELRYYRSQLIKDQVGPLRKRRSNHIMRDIAIMLTVAEVSLVYGLDPTGRSPRRRSGAEVVSQALTILHRPMGRKAVEHIWGSLRGAWPWWAPQDKAKEIRRLPS
jgi:hypothetical protein